MRWSHAPERILARFWHYVYPEPNTGCWLWGGGDQSNGYGLFWAKGKAWRVHRWAYQHFIGPIPEGLYVLHKCDVRPCVNPEHLMLGTHLDNMRDMCAKGRQLNGEANHNAKLTAVDVLGIRVCGGTASQVAGRYGVSESTISQIRRGETWSHVKGEDS